MKRKNPTTYWKGLTIVSGTPVSLLSLPLLLTPQIYFSYSILIDRSNTYQYTKVTFSFPISSPGVINSLDTPAFQTPASIPGTDILQWCVFADLSSPAPNLSCLADKVSTVCFRCYSSICFWRPNSSVARVFNTNTLSIFVLEGRLTKRGGRVNLRGKQRQLWSLWWGQDGRNVITWPARLSLCPKELKSVETE